MDFNFRGIFDIINLRCDQYENNNDTNYGYIITSNNKIIIPKKIWYNILEKMKQTEWYTIKLINKNFYNLVRNVSKFIFNTNKLLCNRRLFLRSLCNKIKIYNSSDKKIDKFKELIYDFTYAGFIESLISFVIDNKDILINMDYFDKLEIVNRMLRCVCKSGNSKMIYGLLYSGANDIENGFKYAFQYGHLNIVNKFIDNKLNYIFPKYLFNHDTRKRIKKYNTNQNDIINIKPYFNIDRILRYTCRSKNINLIKYVLEIIDKINYNKQQICISEAIKYNRINTIIYFINNGYNSNEIVNLLLQNEKTDMILDIIELYSDFWVFDQWSDFINKLNNKNHQIIQSCITKIDLIINKNNEEYHILKSKLMQELS